ncbi:MAG: hypothetical protein ACOX7R_06715 [Acetivibrionales bacterium]
MKKAVFYILALIPAFLIIYVMYSTFIYCEGTGNLQESKPEAGVQEESMLFHPLDKGENSNNSNACMITAKMSFLTQDYNEKPISRVKLVVVGSDGQVIDILTTDEYGLAETELTVAVDRKYFSPLAESSGGLRGTVTVIAYKEGYCTTIIFEVGVSLRNPFQPVYMKNRIPGAINEPFQQLGNNYCHDINNITTKYFKF